MWYINGVITGVDTGAHDNFFYTFYTLFTMIETFELWAEPKSLIVK